MLYSRTQIVFSWTSSVFWPSDLIAILCHFLLLFVFMFVSWKGDTSVVPWSSSQLLSSQYQMLLGLHFQANEGLQLSCRYHITILYYIILYYIILYYILLYYILFYSIILYYIILYYVWNQHVLNVSQHLGWIQKSPRRIKKGGAVNSASWLRYILYIYICISYSGSKSIQLLFIVFVILIIIFISISTVIIIWVAVHTWYAGARYKDAMAKAPALPNGAFLTDALQCQPGSPNGSFRRGTWPFLTSVVSGKSEGKLCQQSHMHPLHVVSWMHGDSKRKIICSWWQDIEEDSNMIFHQVFQIIGIIPDFLWWGSPILMAVGWDQRAIPWWLHQRLECCFGWGGSNLSPGSAIFRPSLDQRLAKHRNQRRQHQRRC